jgi:predicted enzyme related to lactoylglutathione lyase
MTAHPIVHIEIPAHDREVSASFYAALFGWEMQHHPEMQYTTFAAAPGPGGGLATIDGDNVKQGQLLIHVGTDDVDASLNKAVELGGTIVIPKSEIPGIGWFGVFADPVGNRIAVYKDANS